MPLSSLRELWQRLTGQRAPASRLFIVEFDLAELSSHFFNQVLGFKQAAENRGLMPCILLRKNVAASLAEPLNARRIIEFEPGSPGRPDYALDLFAEGDRRLRSLWDAIAEMAVSRHDIVLITSAYPAVIYSLGAWLGRLDSVSRPAVFFRSYNHEYLDLETMGHGERSWLYRFAAGDLSLRPGQERVFLTVNNAALVAPLEQLCSRRIFQMPLPKHYGAVLDRSGMAASPPVIYVHINARTGILLDQIDSIIRATLDRRPDAKFLVKYCLNSLKRGATAALSRDLVERGVKLIPSEQSHADYLQTIARSQVILLPYESIEYQALASGVFAEGAALGNVMVYPSNTWMGRQVEDGHATGVGFDQASAAAVVAAVLRALESLPQLLTQARARSDAFREQHSCARNLDLMLALAGQEHDMRPVYILGTAISFNKSLDSHAYMGRGWSHAEPNGVWTDGPVAELCFRLGPKPLGPKPPGPLDARVLLTPFFTRNGSQRVAIAVNGVSLCEWNFSARAERYPAWRNFTIPSPLSASNEITVTFQVGDPTSPLELGASDDPRSLGLMFHEMVLDDPATRGPTRS
jgi:hypothetical protein